MGDQGNKTSQRRPRRSGGRRRRHHRRGSRSRRRKIRMLMRKFRMQMPAAMKYQFHCEQCWSADKMHPEAWSKVHPPGGKPLESVDPIQIQKRGPDVDKAFLK